MTLSFTTSGAIVDGVAVLVVLQRRVPHDGAGLHVEREQVRVERGHEQLVAEHAEAAVDQPAAGGQARRGSSRR